MPHNNKSDILNVWEKAIYVSGYGDSEIRKDLTGALIRFGDYGNDSSELNYGWEVDHRKPIAGGGEDTFSNKRPLHWENNRSKSDNYPDWTSVVTSVDGRNIHKERGWREN